MALPWQSGAALHSDETAEELSPSMMKPIQRGRGVTESERYLARVADATFLKLWSYPNTYIDRKKRAGETGKELCDLLVVCGDEVIIFSDKSITWPQSDNTDLNWSRWYRRAVKASVDQIRGAERWLREFPDRVFLDPACDQKLPVTLPPLPQRKVHRIAIALGAQSACAQFFDDEDGSLLIYPALKGDNHTDKSARVYSPFAIGDVDPDGPFVHVFDKTALDLIMREMDTVTDFVRYLDERRQFIRDQRLALASNEGGLLAIFMQTVAKDSHYHCFPKPEDLGADSPCSIVVPPGLYEDFIASASYQTKKINDQVSYIWDRLIETFVDNILDGTSVRVLGGELSAQDAEPALRIMAREPRFVRRMLGESVYWALEKAERIREDRFIRVMMPNELFFDQGTAYLIMILAYPENFELGGGYQQYREARVRMLEAYCYSLLYDNRNLKCVVGIALDASSKVTKRRGGSEDLMVIQVDVWDTELERSVREARALFDVLRPERIQGSYSKLTEYPQPAPPFQNRQQRRAAERERKKLLRKAPVHGPKRK